MKRGGARPGAGRKPGTTKPKITDYLTEKEKNELIKIFFEQCKTKPDLMKFFVSHIFGVPRQTIGLEGGEEGEPIKVLEGILRDWK